MKNLIIIDHFGFAQRIMDHLGAKNFDGNITLAYTESDILGAIIGSQGQNIIVTDPHIASSHTSENATGGFKSIINKIKDFDYKIIVYSPDFMGLDHEFVDNKKIEFINASENYSEDALINKIFEYSR